MESQQQKAAAFQSVLLGCCMGRLLAVATVMLCDKAHGVSQPREGLQGWIAARHAHRG